MIALESSLSVSFPQPLLDFKETELKKLGIHNSKDRAMMLRSLATYRVVQEDDRPGEMPRPLMLCGLVYSFLLYWTSFVLNGTLDLTFFLVPILNYRNQSVM